VRAVNGQSKPILPKVSLKPRRGNVVLKAPQCVSTPKISSNDRINIDENHVEKEFVQMSMTVEGATGKIEKQMLDAFKKVDVKSITDKVKAYNEDMDALPVSDENDY
jgi:hypothetical protein